MRLFLSSTNDPYRPLRQRLDQELREAGHDPRLEETFVNTGVGTLVHLAECIEKETDIVLHVVGSKVGNIPTENELRGLLEHCGEQNLRQRFRALFEGERHRRATYTQWEAWLGWFYGKRVFVFEA